jgi:hypothetical protein
MWELAFIVPLNMRVVTCHGGWWILGDKTAVIGDRIKGTPVFIT